MLIAVTFAQPKIGMGGLFCLAIFPDCLDVHMAKIDLNQLVSKCMEVHTIDCSQFLKKPTADYQLVVNSV